MFAPVAETQAHETQSNWTDAAFMALPQDGVRYELVNGELVAMGNSGALHGWVCSTLTILLGGYVRTHNLGVLFDSSTSFKMKNGNRPMFLFLPKNVCKVSRNCP